MNERPRLVPERLGYKASGFVDGQRAFTESYRGELHPLHGTSWDRHRLL